MQVDLKPALELLRRELPALAGVYLFGSYATGHVRADSDLDLAIYVERGVPHARIHTLRGALASALGRDVDLVDLTSVSTVLQAQVLNEGKLVDAPRPAAVALFEVRIMRDYQDLKARRAEIEGDIVARGRVYAG